MPESLRMTPRDCAHEKQRSQEVSAPYVRYHIETKEAPALVDLPPRFKLKRLNNCMDVGECAEVCTYEVHKMIGSKISDPVENKCRGCFLCYLRCPENAICLEINQEFEKLGNSYFTPQRIETIYFEAGTGRVPVSGTGYRGLFTGKGFDSMWLDFSEIVRPTRDGIHGREYISTSVDLGRKLSYLQFGNEKKLISNTPRNIEIPVPVILDAPLACATRENLQLALAKAAARLETFAVVDAKNYSSDLLSYKSNMIPRISADENDRFRDLIMTSRIVEVEFRNEDDAKDQVEEIRRRNPSALISFHVPYDGRSCERVEALAKMGCDIAHCYIKDDVVEKHPDVVKDAICSVHSSLVDSNIRDSITLISGGGIAEAAHVPKSIVLGADAVSVGLAYQIALGCKACYGEEHATNCAINVEAENVELATQRIVNLIGSWRDQLLEILGGMGLREVRRQRGELGRAMFYEDLEERIFGDRE